MSESSPLSISLNLAGVKTTRPIIADGHWCKVRFANCKESVNEKGTSLNFEFHLLDPAPTTDGKQVSPGFPVFRNVALYDKNTPKGVTPDWVLPLVSKIVDACLGTGDPDNDKGRPPRPEFNQALISVLVGKELMIQVKAKTGEFEGNDIKEFRNLQDVAQG